MLTIHTKAPDFTLPDQNGAMHTLSSYKGKYILLYFYPKDNTPGCTTEACVIRDMYKDFESNNTKVMGVSADSVESHQKFADEFSLPFTLLADTEKVAIELYGAKSLLGTKRISYLIDRDGMIAKVYPDVDPSHHGAEILKDIYALNG